MSQKLGLIIGKIGQQLAVSRQKMHRFHMERFSLRKLNQGEGKDYNWVEISNGFTALENFDDEVGIKRAWETIRKNIKIPAIESLGYVEFKKHMPRFDKGCSKLLDCRKQTKLQWLQDPSEINGNNLNDVRQEAWRHSKNKEGLSEKQN
jgi:hypothetical protein